MINSKKNPSNQTSVLSQLSPECKLLPAELAMVVGGTEVRKGSGGTYYTGYVKVSGD